jgi:hypothetical protein
MYINETHFLTKQHIHSEGLLRFCEIIVTSLFFLTIHNILERILIMLYVEGEVLWELFFIQILHGFILSKRNKAASQLEIYHCNLAKIYRVIHKSLREFRTRLRNNQDRHGRKEHINR